jgi:hypothetical protein
LGYETLGKTLLTEHSLIRDLKDDICRMNDKQILAETNVILNKFLDTMANHLKSRKRPDIINFIKGYKDPFRIDQFYSGVLSSCGVLLGNYTKVINTMVGEIQYAYRKTLIFTIALHILSDVKSPKWNDFTPCIKKSLSDFPYLKKVVKPANYFADLEAKDLVWSGRFLNHIKDVMMVDFKRVIIGDLKTPDTYAVVKNKTVIINLPELSKIALFDSPDMSKNIIIDQGEKK